MVTVKPLDSDTRYVAITTEQYHTMMEEGILDEGAPVELIDGLLVPKDRSALGEDLMGHNPLHRAVISLIQSLTSQLEGPEYFLQVQLPIELPPDSEPEPDAAIVRGKRLDYVTRLPRADDVLCVFEAAHSSLRRDQSTKARIYALARIPEYVLVNLQAGVVLVHTLPGDGKYAQCRTYKRGESFRLLTGATIEVSQILPG
jgi:Uma2 family endonuclease